MFTTVRQYRCDPAEADLIARRVDEGFADEVAAMDGFDGYEVVDCGDGVVMTITVCETREACDRSAEMAARFVRKELADVRIERLGAFTGELRVNRARDRMTELIHA
jgi:hypothetical protein